MGQEFLKIKLVDKEEIGYAHSEFEIEEYKNKKYISIYRKTNPSSVYKKQLLMMVELSQVEYLYQDLVLVVLDLGSFNEKFETPYEKTK